MHLSLSLSRSLALSLSRSLFRSVELSTDVLKSLLREHVPNELSGIASEDIFAGTKKHKPRVSTTKLISPQ